MMPIGFTDDMVKKAENKAILHGYDLAIEQLKTAKRNFEPGVNVFDDNIEAPTIEKILEEFKDGCMDEAVEWLKRGRYEALVWLADQESVDEE